MSYRRYRYYNNYRYYNSRKKTFYKEINFDFESERIVLSDFYLHEFMHAGDDYWKRIQSCYSNMYGNISLSYVKRQRTSWMTGSFHLTSLMKGKILNVMPQCLSDTAKHKIRVNNFIFCIKDTIERYNKGKPNQYSYLRTPSRITTINELNEYFCDNYRNIETI